MRILETHISQIDWNFLSMLVRDQVPESRTHDYKAKLPDRRDLAAKTRFLKSISAFANTAGGVLLFGIDSETGGAWTIPGLSDFDLDKDVASLNNLLRSGIDPNLPATEMNCISGPDGQQVLLLGVPRSLVAPHQVVDSYDGKFWARDHRGNYSMTVQDLRQSFQEYETWQREADMFLNERLRKITEDTVHPGVNASRGSIVVHVLPLGRLRAQHNLASLVNSWKAYTEMGGSASVIRHNVEGWITLGLGYSENHAYTQVFRNGGTEKLWTLSKFSAGTYLQGYLLEQEVSEHVARTLACLGTVGVSPPFIVGLTFLNVFEKKFVVGNDRFHNYTLGFDRSHVKLPGFVIETVCSNIYGMLRPLFDSCWQAAGWDESPLFNKDGTRKPFSELERG